MSDRLLRRLGGKPLGRPSLTRDKIDDRRLKDCLRALGVVGLTLMASLLLLLTLALATPENLRGAKLMGPPSGAKQAPANTTLTDFRPFETGRFEMGPFDKRPVEGRPTDAAQAPTPMRHHG